MPGSTSKLRYSCLVLCLAFFYTWALSDVQAGDEQGMVTRAKAQEIAGRALQTEYKVNLCVFLPKVSESRDHKKWVFHYTRHGEISFGGDYLVLVDKSTGAARVIPGE